MAIYQLPLGVNITNHIVHAPVWFSMKVVFAERFNESCVIAIQTFQVKNTTLQAMSQAY